MPRFARTSWPLPTVLMSSLFATLAGTPAHAQIDLVADLRTGSINTSNSFTPPGPFGILPTSAGPLALFAAPDANYGRVLWKSDGTTSGTALVRDFGVDNLTTQSPREFTLYQSRLFFVTNTSSSSELWLYSTDGTSCGTRAHFRIFSDSSANTTVKLTRMGDWLYYVGFSPNNTLEGIELHRTDGTAANTTIVADISPTGRSTTVTSMVTNGSRLFLVATANPNTIGTELYISDGATITPVDIAAGAASSNPSSLTILGNTCYFAATTLASGTELWKSDGTVTGTVLAADIIPGASSSLPTNLSTHDGKLFFACNGRDANNLNIGNELFVYDGTAATLVADLFPGSNSSSPTRVISHGPDAYFSALDNTFTSRLYRTRGTPATTALITSSLRLNNSQSGATVDMASTPNGVVFRAQPNNQTPYSLWVTDGTVGNAVNISNVYPNGSTTSGTSAYMTPLGDGRVIFSGATSSFNIETWITDGTSSGTFELRDIWVSATGSTPQSFVPWNDRLTFFPLVSASWRELYATQGTPSTTTLLFDPATTPTGERNIYSFTPWAGGGAFIAASNTNIPFQVLNIPAPGAIPQVHADDFIATNLLTVNGVLLATAQLGVYTDLYVITTPGGTPYFLDPVNRPHSVSPNSAVEMNGWLYFTGLNESANNQYWLWRTDGEACEPIVRLGTGGETISSITRMTRAGNRLYMRVTSNFTGTELWTSDGTAQGTGIVIDLNPGSASGITQFDILSSGVLGERLVFRGFHPTFGLELFITDGTANGTYCLGDLNPGIAYGTAWSNGNTVQVVGSKIFVAGTSPEFGTELWMSDGTPNSLTRITDLFPGSESSNPSRFTTDGSRLFFVAEGCSTGKELYAADTNGNVTLLAETAPGPDHTYIQHTTWFNGSLYFTHNHPVYGRELFRIRTAPCPADFNGDTVIDLFDYLDFVAAFAANDPTADFNADTVIDFFDYLDFVESFAAGC